MTKTLLLIVNKVDRHSHRLTSFSAGLKDWLEFNYLIKILICRPLDSPNNSPLQLVTNNMNDELVEVIDD